MKEQGPGARGQGSGTAAPKGESSIQNPKPETRNPTPLSRGLAIAALLLLSLGAMRFAHALVKDWHIPQDLRRAPEVAALPVKGGRDARPTQEGLEAFLADAQAIADDTAAGKPIPRIDPRLWAQRLLGGPAAPLPDPLTPPPGASRLLAAPGVIFYRLDGNLAQAVTYYRQALTAAGLSIKADNAGRPKDDDDCPCADSDPGATAETRHLLIASGDRRTIAVFVNCRAAGLYALVRTIDERE